MTTKISERPTISLRAPPELRDWLETQRRRLGERSINATVIVLLEAARKQEQSCA